MVNVSGPVLSSELRRRETSWSTLAAEKVREGSGWNKGNLFERVK